MRAGEERASFEETPAQMAMTNLFSPIKGLVSGSCIAGFCYCLHFTQIQQIAIKIPCLVHF